MSSNDDTIKQIEELVAQKQLLTDQIRQLQLQELKLQGQIQTLSFNLPMIYGKCKKELVCKHYSNYNNTDEQTIISPGDIVEFFRHSTESEIFIYPYDSDEEYFKIPYSKEHFDLFTCKDGEKPPLVDFS